MFVRPSTRDDLAALERLAAMTGAGFTSLNPDRKLLTERLEVSARSFAGEFDDPRQAHYLFLLEDDSGNVAGVCGIKAAVGLKKPFYSYRVGLEVNAARDLGIFNQLRTLYLCSDYTGCAEIGSLFLASEYRRRHIGRLLSRSRFLFMAEFAQRLPEKVIAEMRGVSDADGHSPFWDGLGRHFLSMEFTQADYLSGGADNSFIAELMPRHPIYVRLLSQAARNTIGQVHEDTAAARRILEREGFRYQNYVDIFDAGPTLEVRVQDIRSVRDSFRATVRMDDAAMRNEADQYLLSNTRFADFRTTIAAAAIGPGDGEVALPVATCDRLRVAAGDSVRLVRL